MSVMHDAVEDGVGQRRIADQVMPAVHRELTGDQRGATAVALFGPFRQSSAFVRQRFFGSYFLGGATEQVASSEVDFSVSSVRGSKSPCRMASNIAHDNIGCQSRRIKSRPHERACASG
jgi:hypothetical protein